MNLGPGTRLGPYELTGPLGQGGMGEVYKATDTRLNRTVAIKILPPRISDDGEFKARFEREAQTIAGMNHPNICTLHDVGREAPLASGGSSAGATPIDFLVLEYLEGETLAQRVARGAMPLAEALTAGIAIANALVRAHQAGITHRDLKPANVILTKNGPKLLDFGLAKWTADSDQSLAAMPTRADVTAKGTMLGTLQYMAPEQIEGREADARTDIFAFGALLYEMVTGKRAFEGKSQASLISSIMSREPRPMSLLTPMSPPALEHVVERCLAKEPDERWQSAHSLVVQLQWIAYGDSRGVVDAAVTPAELRRRRLAVFALGLAALVVVILAVPAFLFYQGAPPGAPFSYRMPVRSVTDFAVAPDGHAIVFVGQASPDDQPTLFVRPIGSLTAVALAGTAGAAQPFWSPDNQQVAFVSNNSLKKIKVSGGPVGTLATVPADFAGGTWNRDNVILFGSDKGLYRVSAEGGVPESLGAVDKASSGQLWPCFLPDGKRYVYVARADKNSQLYSGELGSAERKPIVPMATKVTVSSIGAGGAAYLIYQKDSAVFAHAFDTGTLSVKGEPVRLASNVGTINDRPQFDVSPAGVLVYFDGRGGGGGRGPGQENPNGQFGWVNLTGQVIRPVGEPGPWGDIDLSPDGKNVAMTRVDGSGDIWILDWQRGDTGVPTRLTLDPAYDKNPVWTHDGTKVAFTTDRNGNADIFIRNANGVGQDEPLLATPGYESIEAWSRTGSHFAYLAGKEEQPNIWAMPLTGDKKPFPVVVGPFSANEPQFSSDAKWIAYTSNESTEYEVYVMSFPDLKDRKKVSVGGGGQPRWSPDDKILYYRAPNNRAMAVTVTTRPSLAVSSPRQIFSYVFQPGYSNAPFRHQWALAPDGNSFLARAPSSGARAGNVPQAPTTFTSGEGSPASTGRQMISPNRGLTILLNWPALLQGGERK